MVNKSISEAAKRGWTPERRKRQLATYAAKRAAKEKQRQAAEEPTEKHGGVLSSIPLLDIPERPRKKYQRRSAVIVPPARVEATLRSSDPRQQLAMAIVLLLSAVLR